MNIRKHLITLFCLCTFIAANSAVILEEVDDPLEGIPNADMMRHTMGEEGAIVTYKVCLPDISDNLIKGLKVEPSYKSVTVVDACPSDATATCKTKPPYFKYYYTDAKRILEMGKAECDYMKGTWSATTEGKEAEVKKQKGSVTIGEEHYNMEESNLCSLSPIYPNTVIARYQKDHLLIQISAQQKEGKAHYCMFDYINKPKTIHAEGDGSKCPFTYDGKQLKGKISTANPKDFKQTIHITFDIECE